VDESLWWRHRKPGWGAIATISISLVDDVSGGTRRPCQAARSMRARRQFQGNSAARSLIL
jgi:hypothetical protein